MKIDDLRSFALQFLGGDPYAGFAIDGYKLDLQGWNSNHPIFADIISAVKPRQILEIGTWKGASAIHMAKLAKSFSPDAQVLCVDT